MNPEQWLSLKWNGGSTMSDRWLNQSKIIQRVLLSSIDIIYELQECLINILSLFNKKSPNTLFTLTISLDCSLNTFLALGNSCNILFSPFQYSLYILYLSIILILNQPHFYYYLQSTENPISSILFTKLSLNPSSLLASTTTIRFFLAREHPT